VTPKDFTTKALVEELSKREGVRELVCPDPGATYRVEVMTEASGSGSERVVIDKTGPARILVVID
jgi:hypothetical protein